MKTILLFDRDGILTPILSPYATLFGLNIHAIKEHAFFLQAVQQNSEAWYFIVETEDQQPLLDALVQDNKKPIALFTQRTSSMNSFCNMRAFGIDYVLELPIVEVEVLALLRQLADQNSPPTVALPPRLIEKYELTIREKLATLEQLVTEITNKPNDKDVLISLRNAVHKIAGSAAAYGFGELGLLCKTHELYLYKIYSVPKESTPSEQINQTNRRFLRTIRLAVQHIILKQDVASPEEQKKKSPIVEPLSKPPVLMTAPVVVVTTDLYLSRLFQTVSTQQHILLLIESDPRHFRDHWFNQKEPPFVVIVEEFYPFTTDTGMKLVEEIKAQWKEKSPYFGLITQADEIDKRISWLSEGIDLVLKKPLTKTNIVTALTEFQAKRAIFSIRTLIVDDDSDSGAVQQQALEAMGMNIEYLQDETRLFRRLEEFDPHLLLLDINLPNYSGKDLLQTLRSDIRFRHLLIVVVTVIQEDTFDTWAYAENCDEIIHKPINISKMQSRLSNLLKRHAATLGSDLNRLDPITSFYSKEYFLSKLPDVFFRTEDQQLGLLFLKIDLWQTMSELLSPNELKELLILVSNLLRDHFTKQILVCYFDESCFALLFENLSGGEIETITESFFGKIRKKVWISGREDLKIKMSGGLTLFIPNTLTTDSLIEHTAQALAKAQAAGGFHIETIRLTHDKVTEITKKIILVDDDLDLCEVVSFAFKNYGFDISIFNTGEAAIHYFATINAIDPNTVLILDRSLPDRDGVTILRMVKEKFPGKVKAIFLSSLSTEKDVLEGLKVGASDYLTKPFSISVLLQKVLILLTQ